MKIMNDMTTEELKAEEEFQKKVQEYAIYQGNVERTTLDGEWTESELIDSISDEAIKILKDWLPKHQGRIRKDKDLDYAEFLVNKLVDESDVVEEYNKAVDKHRNDEKQLFGIVYFDEWTDKNLLRILKENLVTN
jgi:hypothetical protein